MDALLRQTRPLQEIVVVDNASTDGTRELLADRYPQVRILPMPENVGVGGAVAAGMVYAAVEKRHDWVWTFDADSTPNDDALEALLEGTESLGNTDGEVGMAAGLAIHKETDTCYPPLLWHEGFVDPPPQLLRQPIWFADLVMGSGCMVRREVVEKVGVPRADFFMYFLDYEYCLRVRSYGYRIAVITRSHFAHEVGNARKVRLPGYSRLWSDHAPWQEYYMSRNIMYAAWRLHPSPATKRFAVRHLARHAGGVLLFGSRKLACLKRMVQGVWDSHRERLGVRFLPD
jgi:GT2 family glycosyltransferase